MDWRGEILPTAFADDDKGVDIGCWAMEHKNSIGEYTANMFRNVSTQQMRTRIRRFDRRSESEGANRPNALRRAN
jgi:hypothetical protein